MEKTISDIAEISEMDIREEAIQTTAQFKPILSGMIEWLITHNFEKLVWVLYRIDVDEEKAKKLLSESLPDEAPDVLADLIISRQLKKEELKKHFEESFKSDGDDELKW